MIWNLPAKDTLKLNVDAHPCDDGRWGLMDDLACGGWGCVGAAKGWLVDPITWGSVGFKCRSGACGASIHSTTCYRDGFEHGR
ncbi:hypothetical protein A2U01_0007870 [Trifolium medium]|uniref:Uncharacterized protein n=1 Tax=Trifolium medium TaxID=97028 RepID=A0A392MHL7_9FABA|nr:hypothetical protein [Trifolium medium]